MSQPFVGKITVEFNAKTTKLRQGMADAQKSVSKFEQSARLTGIAVSRVGAGIATFGAAAATTFASLSAVTSGALISATKVAMSWESAFTNVIKVLGDSADGFKTVEKGLRDMTKEIPMTAEEIAGIAESAARLGIVEDDILQFTRTVADLGVTTNMAADEAAEAFARFANITGMSMKDVDRLGSTVVHLGNNLATSEKEITNMGLRIAAAGRQAGLSEAEVMAFAGAISATGIRAEAGGTAFTRVLQRIRNYTEEGGAELQTLAKVAGVTSKEFADSFNKDPANAILSFISGLGEMEKAGGNTSKVLDDLSFSDIRVKDTLLRAAGASDMFTQALKWGTGAWETNTALVDEANLRYSTLASQLQILKNRVMDVIRTIGIPMLDILKEWIKMLDPVISYIEKLADKFNNASDKTKKFITYALLAVSVVSGVLAVFFALVSILGGVIGMVGLLIAGLGTLGVSIIPLIKVTAIVVAVFASIAAAIGVVIGAFTALYAKSKQFRKIVSAEIKAVKNLFSRIFKEISGTMVEVWEEVVRFWKEDFTIISDIVVEFLSSLSKSGDMAKHTSNVVVGVFKVMRKVIVTAVKMWTTSITNFFKVIRPILNVLSRVFNKFMGSIAELGDKFKNLISRFTGITKHSNIFLKALGKIRTVISTLPFALISTIMNVVIEALTGVVKILGNTMDGLAGVIDLFKALFKLDFDGMKTAIGDIFKANIRVLGNVLKTLWDMIAAFIDTIVSYILGREVNITEAITSWYNPFVDKLKAAVEVVKVYGDKFFTPIIDGIKVAYNYVSDTFKLITDKAIEIYPIVKEKFKLIGDIIKSTFDIAYGTIEDFFKVVKALFKGDLDEVKRITSERLGKTEEEFEKIFTDIHDLVGEKVVKIVETIVTKLKELPGKIWDILKDIPSKVALFFEDFISKSVEWVQKQDELNDEFYGGLLGMISDFKEDAPGKFKQAFEDLLGMSAFLLGEFLTKASLKFLEFKESFSDNFEGLKDTGGQLFEKLKEIVIEKIAEMAAGTVSKVLEWKENIKDRLLEIGVDFVEGITRWREVITDFFTDMPGKISEWFGGWKDKISEMFTNTRETITDKLDEWKTTVMDWFKNIPKSPEIKNAGMDMIDELADGNKEKEPEFIDKLGKILVDVLQAALSIAAIVALAVGRELLIRVGRGVTEMKDNLKAKFSAALQVGLIGVRLWLTNFYNSGRDFITKIIDGIANRTMSLYTRVSNTVKGAWRKVKEYVSDFYQAGKDVFTGFINGMGSMVTGVVNKARSIASNAWSAVTGFFGIKSPSRLMISGGQDVGKGFIIGMDKQIRNVRNIAGKFAEAAMPDLSETVSLAYNTPDSIYSTLSSAVNGTVKVSNKDDRLINAVENLGDRIEAMEVKMEGRTVGGIVAPYVKETNDRTLDRNNKFNK